jgi:ParB-like chromosome segregation protein Spo0J
MVSKKDETAKWPAAKVELWPLAKIKPYDKNPRVHPKSQVDMLAASMRTEGVTAPILVDEKGVIIYGHGRRLAALENKFEKFPVVVARGWSEAQKRAARIKDNQIALMSGWDKGVLATELTLLKTEGYDLSLIGFGESQLVTFMSDPTPPNSFQTLTEETVDTAYCCPRCRFEWSGNPKP